MKAAELDEAKRDYEEYRTYCNMVAKFKHYNGIRVKGKNWFRENAFNFEFDQPDYFRMEIVWHDAKISDASKTFNLEMDDELAKIIMLHFETKMNYYKKKLQDRGLEL